MKNAIFITFDDAYVEYAKNFFRSIELNYPNHPEIIISYDGKKPSVLNMLSKVKNSKILPFINNFMDLNGISLGRVNSPKVYYRYILWTSEFDEYDTIIHLDVDILILHPFDELFLQAVFFGVMDLTPGGLTLFKTEFYKNKKLKNILLEDNLFIPAQEIVMMNAGVFVLPKKYRTPEQFELLWSITKRYNKFTDFADQAAISLWCHCNKIVFSSNIAYNFQLSFLANPFVFFNQITGNKLSAHDVKIAHYTWWKTETVFYKTLLEASAFMVELDNMRK